MKARYNSKRFLSDRLGEDLKNPRIRKAFDDAGVPARIAISVAQLREKAGLSQARLASKIGVSQQVISRMENPEKSNMTLSTLSKVASALGKHLSVEFR